MGLHASESTANDTPLKPAISEMKGSTVPSGAPKRVRFIDEEQLKWRLGFLQSLTMLTCASG